jgi:glycine cleavage system H protein
MKEIHELDLPDNLRYTKDHEWARLEEEGIRVGITDYAQDQMGDIVYVELPSVGSSFARGEQFATIESVKAVAEIYMPVSGEVQQTNSTLNDSPELLNKEPYGGGWIVLLKASDPSELETLMSKDEYLEFLRSGA